MKARIYMFKRFGALKWYDGVPVYVGSRCLTKSGLAWWWPWNWIVSLILFPVAVARVFNRNRSPQ